MSKYDTPHYAKLFRSEASAARNDAEKNRDEKKHLRDTMTKIVKAFEGDTEAQEKILEVVYSQGHDGHLMRRLTNIINS